MTRTDSHYFTLILIPLSRHFIIILFHQSYHLSLLNYFIPSIIIRFTSFFLPYHHYATLRSPPSITSLRYRSVQLVYYHSALRASLERSDCKTFLRTK